MSVGDVVRRIGRRAQRVVFGPELLRVLGACAATLWVAFMAACLYGIYCLVVVLIGGGL